MAPKEANIFVVEDNPNNLTTLCEFLTLAGHNIAFYATTLPEALGVVENLKPGAIDVALVDGNLYPDSYGGWDGQQVADAIRTALPGVKVISISVDRQAWSDMPNVTRKVGSRMFAQIVTDL